MTGDHSMPHADEGGHAELSLLAELAPLGVLEPDAHRRLGRHLDQGCAVCGPALEDSWASLEVLALATPVLTPGASARRRLMGALGGRPRRRGARAAGWLLAAVLAAAVGLGVLGWRQLRVEQVARKALESELLRTEARAAGLVRRNAHLENAIDVLGGPRLRTASLSGESDFASARMRVLVDSARHRTLVVARRLPAPPAGRTYQLWLVAGETPRSLAIFRPDERGRALRVRRGRLVGAEEGLFAVSVEPEGGAPRPTGPVVLAGR